MDILLGCLKTCGLLIVLEIFSTAFLPAIGIENVRLAFNVLIVLYLAFKIETPFLAFLILIVQYVHSAFSIEGWGIGTLVGIVVAMSVRYLRDLLQFSTAISTMVVVQIFQIAWFLMSAFLLSLKLGSFENFFFIFWKNVPASFVLTLMAPFFFKLLDNFWRTSDRTSGVTI